jgi:hypothetical protein
MCRGRKMGASRRTARSEGAGLPPWPGERELVPLPRRVR